MSRDFWMPDQSCRMCYECDSQFTIFNRRHHCRLCGRVFCNKCSSNTIPVNAVVPSNVHEDPDRIRVCNYCFKQWKLGQKNAEDTFTASSPGLSRSPSSLSLVSSHSSDYTGNSVSSASSVGYPMGPLQHESCSVGQSPGKSELMDLKSGEQFMAADQRKHDYNDGGDVLTDQFASCYRSDDEDNGYPEYKSQSRATNLNPDICFDKISYSGIDHIYEPHEVAPNVENGGSTCSSAMFHGNLNSERLDDEAENLDGKAHNNDSQSNPSAVLDGEDIEPVDYENNGLLWLPPDPEHDEDDTDALLSDDDGGGEDVGGEWGGYLRCGTFGGAEYRSRDKSNEEHRKTMKKVVDGHFRALITQLLQAENLPVSNHGTGESWLDIITTLSWDAATFLMPDTSMGGGMDPGGYVKVKCIGCGARNESMVAKGVVCKKNVAHRRMNSKIDKARLLLLGGALEYQRVSNHLSSVDTLLQQEMEHLKMAVAKIDAHHPSVLLVENSVSRCAQEYLLAKNISLVLNIKRPLLERIARCTGAQIVSSIDHLSSPKLGYCDLFRVEKILENLGSAGQGGKKLAKTLMFFEGCPKPLGCTILLKGGSGDELKRVKNVVHYGVFAAYHLALETSFLADEGASMPELPLTSPMTVSLPDAALGFERSISVIPNTNIRFPENPQRINQPGIQFVDTRQSSRIFPISESELQVSTPQTPSFSSAIDNLDITSYLSHFSGSQSDHVSAASSSHEKSIADLSECIGSNVSLNQVNEREGHDDLISKHFFTSDNFGQGVNCSNTGGCKMPVNYDSSDLVSLRHHSIGHHGELSSSKEDFPLSPTDHHSILVSLSTRCVWKRSVCERAHLFRIKYYGSFDKPLGRFLRDQLFDQDYHCRSCEMPSEAHIHCYTHRHGSLTISVKKHSELFLPGEREGKIWMWHRCLRCPRISGFPPATKRVVMSDAAWGLSFGKFLELSFSNHAAASRVASCGHSLHRDCLRFYGFGRMVACFRYAPIRVHSVYLPPPKLEFNYQKQQWLQKELDEVIHMSGRLFLEISKVLPKIFEQIIKNFGVKAPQPNKRFAELKLMLQKEKEDHEELLWRLFNKESQSGQPEVDILDINNLKRQLIFFSYVWDQRLIHVSRYDFVCWGNTKLQQITEKSVNSEEKPTEIEVVSKFVRGFQSCESLLSNFKPDIVLAKVEQGQIDSPYEIQKQRDLNTDERNSCQSSGASLSDQPDVLEFGKTVRRARSVEQFQALGTFSNNCTAWTGTHVPASMNLQGNGSSSSSNLFIANSSSCLTEATKDNCSDDNKFLAEQLQPSCSVLPTTGSCDLESPSSWVRIPFSTLYQSFNNISSTNAQKHCKISGYNPAYISLFSQLLHCGGARLLLPVVSHDIVLPIYDDEPTSIISYALVSPEYKNLMSGEAEKIQNDSFESSSLFSLESLNFLSALNFEEASPEPVSSIGSSDESLLSSGSKSFSGLDPLLVSSSLHTNISFSDDGPPGKMRYNVTCYFAKHFEVLRRAYCSSELDFIRSLSRCKKWGAQGGKSNVFFAKSVDDRFIIKQVTKTELESFIQFGQSYFKYMSEATDTACPTCLAKILGIYQVMSKPLKGGKESRIVVLVMENLLFNRNITQLYDLKGSARSRYNPDASGNNKVLLDQNLLEAMRTSPIFLGTKSKRLLERAVWNDTSFLASIDVMDYSLLVGMDEEKQELVLGIIDFMRQYTWDKHLETWVKASGILGGPKNTAPTVISPMQYKKRFRKAMSAYFLMVPDQWFPQ